jgi:AcrR family transcriptional regulator
MAVAPRAERMSRRPEVGRSTGDRLKQALAQLTQRDTASDRHKAMSVAALCRLAGVSRNLLYRYHPGVLQCLREHQRQCRSAGEDKADFTAKHLRGENVALREQVAKLAALVDHYYAAYRETRVLVERRDCELAELRRSLNSKPLVLGG